ncbi:MAG: CRISPR-associated protein Cas4 [Candidatus Brockarchaeota archaeon]|nr:CRISPR-associated protein Cas4 [Candidatus Brockarchaeota archaeon]
MKGSGSGGKIQIDVWEIVQYHYCPRKLYFLRTLGVPSPSKRKMDVGSEEHARERKRLVERKAAFGFKPEEVKRVHSKLVLEAQDLALVGQVDNVVELADGQLIPVEIKYSDYVSAYGSRVKQLVAYAILLERNFEVSVRTGILYFPMQNRQIRISISHEDKRNLIADVERMRRLIASEKVPPKARREACRYCEVSKYCA